MRRSTARHRQHVSTRRSVGKIRLDLAGWYEEYSDLLRAYLAKLAHSVHDAEDIVQEAFLHVWFAASTGPILNPKALLFTTAQNLLKDHCRRAHTHMMRGALQVDEVEIPDSCEPSQVMESEQALAQILDTLERLRSPTRKAFLLDRVELYSHAQIATRMGITVSMVEQHIRLCMDAFESTGFEQPRHACGRYSKVAA